MLSISHNDQEINVAFGEYIAAKAIEKAFALTSALPYHAGVAANQPNPFPAEKVIRIWLTITKAINGQRGIKRRKPCL
jgi:hypothetical protein